MSQARPKQWEPPADMDPECIDLCTAMNGWGAIRTTDSCCGHGKNPYRVFFMSESLEDLPPLLYYFDACHTGCPGWRVIVYTDCLMSSARFMLEGPVGEEAYAASKVIAKCIDGYFGDPDV